MTGFYAMDKAGKMNRVSADEAFPFLAETGHTVSLVGAGGKTTLMFILADFCCKRGMKVLVSTTTHILKPEDGSYIENEKQLWDRWNSGKPAVAGQRAEGGKLSMLPESVLQQYSSMADIVFLEADGSKRLPLKVPAKQEPVLTEESDIVIALCGMNALGKPLAEVCFRLQEACELLKKDKEDRVSAEDLARILTSPRGSLKRVEQRKTGCSRAAGPREYYMVLNQCDDGLRLKQAAEIISMVRAESTGSILASCLKEQGEFAD